MAHQVSSQVPSQQLPSDPQTLTILVVGCLHGELDRLYDTVARHPEIDFVLVSGDFQAVRNVTDLDSMAVPYRYRQCGHFASYMRGERRAVRPTVFIGGNHEASAHLAEARYGGWLAHNIYYMGMSGVVTMAGIRIAGLSGIFKEHDYEMGQYEQAPFNEQTRRSVYHVRKVHAYRMSLMRKHVDIVMSHDWPRGIVQYGERAKLVQRKPFLKHDIETNALGSVPAYQLMHGLQPTKWLSAHMHVRFSATVRHEGGRVTEFLALDKCLPKRAWAEIWTMPARGPKQMAFDPEWLAIVKATASLDSCERRRIHVPPLFSPLGQPLEIEAMAAKIEAAPSLAMMNTPIGQQPDPGAVTRLIHAITETPMLFQSRMVQATDQPRQHIHPYFPVSVVNQEQHMQQPASSALIVNAEEIDLDAEPNEEEIDLDA